jgi:ketosteroid isomerase-like protein
VRRPLTVGVTAEDDTHAETSDSAGDHDESTEAAKAGGGHDERAEGRHRCRPHRRRRRGRPADALRHLTAMAAPIDLVRRLVNEVMNGGDLALLDELCTPSLAPKLRRAFSEFRSAFPDWHQDVREFVIDGRTVVARMRCTGTHQGEWQGLAASGRPMRVDEVYFLRVADDRITGLWGLEDTWTRMRQLAGDDASLGELGSLS